MVIITLMQTRPAIGTFGTFGTHTNHLYFVLTILLPRPGVVSSGRLCSGVSCFWVGGGSYPGTTNHTFIFIAVPSGTAIIVYQAVRPYILSLFRKNLRCGGERGEVWTSLVILLAESVIP